MIDPKKVKELERVSVTNEGELQKAIQPFMTDSAIYKLLVEGMEMVKRQSAYYAKASEVPVEDFGGYQPALPVAGSYGWVDTLIERRLNGKRDGLTVTWSLPEGKFTFDPWTRKLEKANG